VRIVGIDFGMKRIGIAISDPTQSFALPLCKIERVKDDKINAKNVLSALHESGEIASFVVGLPLHLSGAESEMSVIVRKFAEALKTASQKEVAFFDERFSSKQADTLLREMDMKRKKRTEVVDLLSATIILQSYLDCNK
jgi:putative holliday junction resolvase